MQKKIIIQVLFTIFLIFCFIFLGNNTSQASGAVIGSWDLTGDGLVQPVGSVVATLTDDGVLTIIGDGKVCDYDKPEAADAECVNPINKSHQRELIKKVHITGEIKNISSYLCYYFINLEEVVIDKPDSISYIGEGAFFGCKKLKSFTVPKNVTQIGGRAFCHCHDLQELDLSSSLDLVRISHEAFRDCWSLKSVQLPSGLNILGYEAFFNCISLDSVIIPNSILSMGTLGTPEDPEGIGTMDQTSEELINSQNTSGINNVFTVDFSRNSDQEEFKPYIKALLTANGISFEDSNCISKLKQLLLEPRVWYYSDSEVMKEYANQRAVAEMIINPLTWDISEQGNKSIIANLDEFGTLTIEGTGKIKDYAIAKSPWYKVVSKLVDVNFSDEITSVGKYLFYGAENINSIFLPDTVTQIHEGAFSGCKNLVEFYMPFEIEEIGANAFEHCEKLEAVTLSEKINKISENTFKDCYSLKNVDAMADITVLGNMAFYNCPQLSYTVSPYLETIGSNVFTLDSSLTTSGKIEYYALSKVMNNYVESNSSERTFESKSLDEIYISSDFEKGDYFLNSSIDTSGLALGVTYYNGSSKDYQLYKEVSDGFTCSPDKLETVGSQEILINYGGATTTTYVSVNECLHPSWENGICIDCGYVCPHTEFYPAEEEGKHICVCGLIESHTFGDYEVTLAATCEDEGSEVRVCTKCGEEEERTINALGHTGATHENGGVCTRCEMIYEDHFSSDEVKEYISTKTGHTPIYSCVNENCSKTYTGEEEAHILKNCKDTGNGTHLGVCDVCGKSVEQVHEFSNYEIQKNATCLETGYSEGYCLDCGSKDTKEIPKSDHSWEDATCVEPKTCTICHITEGSALGHNYKSVVTPPTATSQGYTTHTCTRCDYSYTDSYTPPTGVTEKLYVKSSSYQIGSVYITQISPGTTVKALKESLLTNATQIEIYSQGSQLKEADYVGTSMKIVFKFEKETKEYTLVVAGDLTGDGKIQNGDLIKLVRYKVELLTLDEPFKLATDVNCDGKYATDGDIIKLARVLVNLAKI